MDTRRNITKVEVLAPAGSFETLCAVIEAGADAVYIGGTRFGARAYADNPGEDELLRAIDYAHLRGVRVYMTVNTLLTDRELTELYAYMKPYYEAGLDAAIVQDFGVLSFLRSVMPDLPIHISTQMTVTSEEAAALFDEGVTRIVPARELTLSEIAAFRKQCDKELEIFVHGALCYCYSGQCLFSSLIGARSGNRGRCAQPCRKEYRYEEGTYSSKGYLLSPKDQCLLPRLHELLETGIHSLKIEGRMKRAEYAAGVTSIYRKWVDRFYALGGKAYREYLRSHEDEMQADLETMAELYNRGGFCEGYVFDSKGERMMCVDRPNHSGVPVGTAELRAGRRPAAEPHFTSVIGPGEVMELRTKDERYVLGEWTTPRDMSGYRIPAIPIDWKREYGRMPEKLSLTIWRMKKEPLLNEIEERYVRTRRPIALQAFFTATEGQPISLTISDTKGAHTVTAYGPEAEPSVNAGATEESVREKLSKTGGTAYCLQSCEVYIGDKLFLPVSNLNRLRREALALYEEEYLKEFRRTLPADSKREMAELSAVQTVETGNATVHSNVSGELTEKRVVASVMNAEQLTAVLRSEGVTDLYIDMEGDYESCLKMATGLPRYLMLPRALKGDTARKAQEEAGRLIREYSLSGIVVRTPAQLSFAQKEGFRIEADRTLYCMNSTSVEWITSKGVSAVTFSEELHRKDYPVDARGLFSIYGRSVVMVSEQCPRKTTALCGRKGSLGELIDGEGVHFPARAVCRYCHSLVYNAHPLSLLREHSELSLSCFMGVRLDFTTERADEVTEVLRRFREAAAGGRPEQLFGTTRGHFYRGVE